MSDAEGCLINHRLVRASDQRPTVLLVLAGSAVLFAAYLITFALTTNGDLRNNSWSAAYNAVPAILLGVLAHALLERFVWWRPLWARLLVQIPLAALFAVGWYLTILVFQGLRSDWLSEGFSIRPFVPVAFVWQMFQGVTFYAVAALASLTVSLSHRLAAVSTQASAVAETAAAKSAGQTSILVRNQGESEAVQAHEIVRVSGAGDYCEVVLDVRRILSTSALAEFEALLPDDSFVRVHRSHLVGLRAIQRTEPAGNGRTTIHLRNGETLTASRAGTRLLREVEL